MTMSSDHISFKMREEGEWQYSDRAVGSEHVYGPESGLNQGGGYLGNQRPWYKFKFKFINP